MTVEEVSNKFSLPNLCFTLAEYIAQVKLNVDVFTINAQHSVVQPGAQLLFTELEVWTSFYLQLKTYHAPHESLSPHTVNASLLSKEWPHEQGDPVIFNTDLRHEWPYSGIKGIFIYSSLHIHSKR